MGLFFSPRPFFFFANFSDDNKVLGGWGAFVFGCPTLFARWFPSSTKKPWIFSLVVPFQSFVFFRIRKPQFSLPGPGLWRCFFIPFFPLSATRHFAKPFSISRLIFLPPDDVFPLQLFASGRPSEELMVLTFRFFFPGQEFMPEPDFFRFFS